MLHQLQLLLLVGFLGHFSVAASAAAAAAAASPGAGAAAVAAGSPVMAVGAPYDEESAGLGDPSRAQSCVPAPIQVPMCSEILFNTTASYVKQEEVDRILLNLKELVQFQCAPYLRLFACSMHLPFCNRDQNLLVRPCQEFCLSVRSLCRPALSKLGYEWPSILACEALPLEAAGSNRKNLCIRPNPEEFQAELVRLRAIMAGRDNRPGAGKEAEATDAAAAAAAAVAAAAAAAAAAATASSNAGESSSAVEANGGRWPNGSSAGAGAGTGTDYQDPREGGGAVRRRCSQAELTVGGPEGSWCARRCHASFLFAREDREFASSWMLAWSVVGLVSSGLALATFGLDARRFRYPERPVVWVAACHLVHSGAHLLRAALGPELACSRPSGGDLALVSRHAGQWCAAVFLLLYFSWLAGLLWWLALALCWHLSTVRRWGHQLLAERAVWLHLLAWGAPLLLSVVLLVLHRIEGDELTHLCVVDGSRPGNLLMFQVVPVGTALLLGLSFLGSAMRAVLRSPGPALAAAAAVGDNAASPHSHQRFQQLHQAPASTSSSSAVVKVVAEQQAAKISLFSFLFVLPTACVLAANIYELMERHGWTASLEAVLSRPDCVGIDGLVLAAASAAGLPSASSASLLLPSQPPPPAPPPMLPSGDCTPVSRPSSVFYMLKIFTALTAGLPAGLLIWANGQAATAWRQCLGRALACGRRSAKAAAAMNHQYQHQQQQHQLQQQQQFCQSQKQQQQHQQQQQHIQLHQMPYQQYQHQHQHQQPQHQYQVYQRHSYATLDSVRCDSTPPSSHAAAPSGKPQHHVTLLSGSRQSNQQRLQHQHQHQYQHQHQHQQASVSNV